MIRRKPDGTVEADTVEELIAWEARLEPPAAPSSGSARTRDAAPRARPKPEPKPKRKAKPEPTPRQEPGSEAGARKRPARRSSKARDVRFDTAMQMLVRAGKQGVLANELWRGVGLEGPRGLAGVMQALRHRLEQAAPGERVQDFVYRVSDNGEHRWVANAEKLRQIGLAG